MNCRVCGAEIEFSTSVNGQRIDICSSATCPTNARKQGHKKHVQELVKNMSPKALEYFQRHYRY